MKNYKTIKTQEDFNNFFDKLTNAEVKEEFFDLIKHFNILNSEGVSRICMTQEQFDAMFVIKNPNETRGRKKKVLTEEEKQKQIEMRREYQRKRYKELKNND